MILNFSTLNGVLSIEVVLFVEKMSKLNKCSTTVKRKLFAQKIE